MAEEEGTAAATEKGSRIQRVFINLLDSYSSGNIGKVSGGGSEYREPQSPAASPPHRGARVPEPSEGLRRGALQGLP